MITENYTVISPAYGRDYKSAAKAKEDFFSGKDFVVESIGIGGKYCSIRDFAVGLRVEIRYAALAKATIVEIPTPVPTTSKTLKLSGNMITIPINRETGECEVEDTNVANPNASIPQEFPKGRW